MRRFEVVEQSMEPTLREGDYLIAVAEEHPVAGDLVVFEHPWRPGFRLVKRVVDVDGERMEVTSDNAAVTMADSRSFGVVAIAGSYRVVGRYWPPRRIRVFRRPGRSTRATPSPDR
jgi:signal peptidase I